LIHLPAFILDLGLILMAAGIVTVLFRKIGQPVVLGYIIAGFLVSSHVWFLPSVTDLPDIQVWADIGVIFLLFALGLEFSFKKLLKVGGPATLTALIEVFGMIALGNLFGHLFGWSLLDSLFLGGILAISSTTIIIRTINETGMKGRGFVDFVFGILIVEDLVAVLLLVLLSTVAATTQFNGGDLLTTALKLIFFVIFCFVAGIFILPTLIKLIKKNSNDEMLLIVVLGLCFAMVKMSTYAGFSPALGAFIMGSILAETSEVKKIEHLIKPIRDLFGAIFFVSVGMLIDPQTIFKYGGVILILTFITIIGKFITITLGGILSRRNLRHSLQAGLSLAQIGEFSFIIASLGQSLKVTSGFLYPVAVGISVITTFVTPYLIQNVDAIAIRLEKFFPFASYETKKLKTPVKEKNERWQKNFISSLVHILVNAVIIYGIFYFMDSIFTESHRTGFWFTIVFSTPFFWAILMKKREGHTYNKEERISFISLEVVRILIVWGLFRLIAFRHLPAKLATSIALFSTLGILLLLSPVLKRIYFAFEKHFINNFFEAEKIEMEMGHHDLAPWDAHITNFVIPPESEVVGKTLHELKIREIFGISIALIERGELIIAAPGREEKLFPNDRVALIGSDEKLKRFTDFLQIKKSTLELNESKNYALHRIFVTEKMNIAFKTIKKSRIREKTQGLVAGIERHGERILNPDSNIKLIPGDILWIVGDIRRINEIN
jgi:CPA2 family monovalent cation:H+ antiporter-2